MDFQIQVENLGSSRERAQITFRTDEGVMVHQPISIVEWSTTEGKIRTVQGRLLGIGSIVLHDDVFGDAMPTAEEMAAAVQAGMTPGELLKTEKARHYCGRPGCGHGDNIHGPFCFASGCACGDWVWPSYPHTFGPNIAAPDRWEDQR